MIIKKLNRENAIILCGHGSRDSDYKNDMLDLKIKLEKIAISSQDLAAIPTIQPTAENVQETIKIKVKVIKISFMTNPVNIQPNKQTTIPLIKPLKAPPTIYPTASSNPDKGVIKISSINFRNLAWTILDDEFWYAWFITAIIINPGMIKSI